MTTQLCVGGEPGVPSAHASGHPHPDESPRRKCRREDCDDTPVGSSPYCRTHRCVGSYQRPVCERTALRWGGVMQCAECIHGTLCRVGVDDPGRCSRARWSADVPYCAIHRCLGGLGKCVEIVLHDGAHIDKNGEQCREDNLGHVLHERCPTDPDPRDYGDGARAPPAVRIAARNSEVLEHAARIARAEAVMKEMEDAKFAEAERQLRLCTRMGGCTLPAEPPSPYCHRHTCAKAGCPEVAGIPRKEEAMRQRLDRPWWPWCRKHSRCAHPLRCRRNRRLQSEYCSLHDV